MNVTSLEIVEAVWEGKTLSGNISCLRVCQLHSIVLDFADRI